MPSTPILIRLTDVAHIVGLRKSRIYGLIQCGDFPSPVKIGRASRWVASEISEWVHARINERAASAEVCDAR
jgi:prophage regulatory protein